MSDAELVVADQFEDVALIGRQSIKRLRQFGLERSSGDAPSRLRKWSVVVIWICFSPAPVSGIGKTVCAAKTDMVCTSRQSHPRARRLAYPMLCPRCITPHDTSP